MGVVENSKWIPVTENLPTDVLDFKDLKQLKVLVCTKKGVIKTCLYRWIVDYRGNFIGWGFTVHGVIAWQPLPERYRGDV